MSAQGQQGRIDLAKFREAMKEQQEAARRGPEGYTLVQRAKIRLVEDQLKEARVGEYTILCDEPKARKGGGKGPSPLQYFVAAVGF
ncbi:MAG: hypothetical protein HYV08_17295 [Deltaproteobacteria bacterium]|nr:hypothetical protein [Deltaproteobacteria bacterium]